MKNLHVDVEELLISGRPFNFAHLIKFERPSRPDAGGVVSISANRYTYLSDASRDIAYDDGSIDHNGVSNGSQKYIANKVLKLTDITEQSEARVSTTSLILDGNGVGAVATYATAAIVSVGGGVWDITWDRNISEVGFQEGDKIELSGDRTGKYNILSFRTGNIVRIEEIDDTLTADDPSNLTISLSSEEIMSILLNKADADYATFINREVFIFRDFYEEGARVGTPYLLFKGIISSVKFQDNDPEIKVTWGLSSHWADFSEVVGRLTSDSFHRALDINGNPQPDSAIKESYGYDKGFIHSETSINLLATYSVQVEKQEVKSKKGFFGIGAKVKVKKSFVAEDRNTELDFQLNSKAIPVHYGIRNMTGIPVFADTLNNDNAKVYVVYVLGEGEMGGIYDVIVDDKSLICNDKADSDARSTQTSDETVDVLCLGRADRGDVLTGDIGIDTVPGNQVDYYVATDEREIASYSWNPIWNNLYSPYTVVVEATTVDIDGKGVIHEESINIAQPQNIVLDFFSGKPDQKASSFLTGIAAAGNFKIQNDYWTGTSTAEYWSPNHRLLDSAYIVAEYTIEEGETSISDIEVIARGKVIDCYNYDYSYTHDNKEGAEDADNFLLGETLDLKDSSDDSVINSSVQIIDKWSIMKPNGTVDWRFRFSADPVLGYDADGVPTVTQFYMDDGVNTWTMITYNNTLDTGTVGAKLSRVVTSVQDNGGDVEITHGGIALPVSAADPLQGPKGTIYSGGGSRRNPEIVPVYL